MAGKLGKGGEPDVNTAAKMVLLDWQRGKIPYFEMPPELPGPNPNAPPELPVGQSDDPIFSKAQSVLMQVRAHPRTQAREKGQGCASPTLQALQEYQCVRRVKGSGACLY